MSYSRWSSSDWYIFWNADSGKTKEEQKLSVWNVNEPTNILRPHFSYEDVKYAYENKNWDFFCDEPTEIDTLEQCLKEWLEEVDEMA